MQRIKQLFILCFLVCGTISAGWAQTVTFYFVAPTATIDASFPGVGQTDRMPPGYSYVAITAANSATFLTLAPTRIRYVYTQLQPGTAIRNRVNQVFDNSNRTVDVEYYLADDHTGLASANGGMFVAEPDGARHYIWPAANGVGPLGTGRYRGWVMLAEHFLESGITTRPGGVLSIDEVVLHESSHTQWVGEFSKWPAITSMIAYGADSSHSITELLGDQELAINEGIGTYYGFTLNRPALDSLLEDFRSPNYRYFVESRSVLAGDAELNAVPSRLQYVLKDEHGNNLHYPDGRDLFVFLFPWRDVPGFKLLFAESTSTAFYSLYWLNAYRNRDTAFSFIGFSANSMHQGRMKRSLLYSCNRLALRMEAYNATAVGQADTSKTSSMLPFAILDLITHFGMTDAAYRAEYDRYYPDRQPRAYVEYFNHRAAIRTLVAADLAASPIRFTEAMAKIRDYCKRPGTIF